jgi:hypothetical protein
MAIQKYTNFEQINVRLENEGKYLQPEDLFIVTKEESEISEFGTCKYDVMEVSVYDINNNILPHKSGNNVSYVKSGDIKNYVYNVTNKGGQKELAIDAEKLLTNLGFSNGILKVNLNFVRNRVGSDDAYTRVWIQEISPSREEVRILPLKTKNEYINKITNKEFEALINGEKEFKFYKKEMLDSIDSFSKSYLVAIKDFIISKFGNEFFISLKKDFGVSSFDQFIERIHTNFKDSVNYYLSNKYSDIEQSNFGKPLPTPIFEDCERYKHSEISIEIEKMLYKCVSNGIKSLKRRTFEIQNIPQEFSPIENKKLIEDSLNSFQIPTTNATDIYSPRTAELRKRENLTTLPIATPINNPRLNIINIEPLELPGPPWRPVDRPLVEPDPIDPPIDLIIPPNPGTRDAEPLPAPIDPVLNIGGIDIIGRRNIDNNNEL